MILTNIKMALSSIKSARIRSFLTMLGVVIGVASVVITISIGEGVKNQVVSQINQYGNDTIVIRAGKTFERDASGRITNIKLDAGATSTLSEKDIVALKKIPGITAVAPSSRIDGDLSTYETERYPYASIVATSPSLQDVLSQQLEFGEFFAEKDNLRNTAVIGSTVASDVFNQRDPVGRLFTIRGQDFTVRGVLAPAAPSLLNVGTNINSSVYIPSGAAKKLLGTTPQINEITLKIDDVANNKSVTENVRKTLLANRNGQEDFTILRQEEYLSLADQIFTVLTTFVAAIAGISLIVGGIGIMNIMLVSVSERTREIGVRKALGATNQQILSQFLIEATVISMLGGIFGVILSLVAIFIIRTTTSISPAISLATVTVAVGVATLVGIIFGMAPAIQAARKDPIEALRHE